MVKHTEQIIVKKRRISFEKVKLADANSYYKTKLKDKGAKYYTKFKVKDIKTGKDKDRMLISVKLKYKDWQYKDKVRDTIIVTRNDLKDEAEIDAFIQKQILIIERNIQNERALELRSECDDDKDYICEHVTTSEEYE